MKYPCPAGDSLDMLGEEASEVIQEVFKMKRFGHLPGGKAPGYAGTPPRDNILKELGDLFAVTERLIDEGFITDEELMSAVDRKHARLKELFGLERPIRRFDIIFDSGIIR